MSNVSPAVTTVNSSNLVTGSFLAHLGHKKFDNTHRSFLGGDLCLGNKYPGYLSLRQASGLVGVGPTSIWWAIKQMPNRQAIEAGYLPLVPPQAKKNFGTLQEPNSDIANISDTELIGLARAVGPDRMFAAAMTVESTVLAAE